MKGFQSKPALKVLIPFVLGILTAHKMNPNPFLLYFMILCCGLGALIAFLLYLNILFDAFIFMGVFASAILNYELKSSIFPANDITLFAGSQDIVSVEGIIRSPVEMRPRSVQFVLEADSLWQNEKPVNVSGNVLIKLYTSKNELEYGDRVIVKGRLREPAGERNPGAFNYKHYLACKNIRAILTATGNTGSLLLERRCGSFLFQYVVYPARRFMLRFIDEAVGGQEGAVLRALLAGAREDIDPKVREAFANVGVIHVLAVSGLHVGFIVLGLFFLFQLVGLTSYWRVLMTVAILSFYACLTGLNPPVIRASVMAVILLFGITIQRQSDMINSLSLAAFFILLWNPLSLFAVSFQLSFSAVLGIVLLYDKFKVLFNRVLVNWEARQNKFLLYFFKLFLVSFSAQIVTIPLTAFYFGRVPLLSLFANLVVVPLVALVVGLGFTSVLCAAFYWSMGFIYAQTSWMVLSMLLKFVHWIHELPFSYLSVARPSVSFFLCYFSILGLFLVWDQKNARNKMIIFVLLIGNFIIWSAQTVSRDSLKITFFDVGQGDSALLEFPDGKIMLIDAGDDTDMCNYGERVVAPYLIRQGIKRIDALVISHAHSDHIGGVPYLLEHFDVGRIIKSEIVDSSHYAVLVDSMITLYDVPVKNVVAGDTISGMSSTLVQVLHPSAYYCQFYKNEEDLNDFSVVLKIIYGKNSFLFTGDAGQRAENVMISYQNLLQSDIIKVGHHGSASSSTPKFRKLVKPEYAVISVGRNNRHNLPNPEICLAWEKEGAQVASTDKEGAIVFLADGEHVKRIR